MYMILYWVDEDSFLTCIHNEDGSIKLFPAFKDAKKYLNEQRNRENLRIISVEEVR